MSLREKGEGGVKQMSMRERNKSNIEGDSIDWFDVTPVTK